MIHTDRIKNLMENPDVIALIEHIKEEAEKLNTLDDLPGSTIKGLRRSEEISLEVMARARAYERLKEILEPFLDDPKAGKKFNGKDYVT